ncbi:MAG: BrnA antitoxin family protein [Gemmatimonadota bacterium]
MRRNRTRLVVKTADQLGPGFADFARMDAMTEEEIERTSPPELANLPDDFWVGGRVVEPVIKLPISIRVDEDVLDWFRSQGPRYQTKMNAVLRAHMKEHAKPAARKPAPRKKRAKS